MPDMASSRTIRLQAPFDLALTTVVLRRLPVNTLYRLGDGELRFVVVLDGLPTVISVRQSGPRTVTYRTLGAPAREGWLATIEGLTRRLLGLDVDMAPLRTRVSGDPILEPLARSLEGMRPPQFLSLWETLVQVIPFQQVSLAAAMAVVNRLAAAYGPRARVGDAVYVGVPALDKVVAASDTDLRACGLSQAKARALRGCGEWIQEGAIREDELAGLPDAEAGLRLRALPGIGPWSAQLILLRGFGRLGNFPEGDSGAARGLRAVFGDAPDPEAAAAAALDRLGPWRGYLYFMLLARRIQDAV